MNVHTKPQIINDSKGMPEYVVIPYAEYIELTQQSKIDLEHGIPSAVVDLMLDKNHSPARAWREYLNITQAEAADRVGITQSAYCQFENAQNPRPATRSKIAAALGINVEQLDC